MKLKIFSTIIVLITVFCLYLNNQAKTYQGLIFGTYYKITVTSNKDISKDISKVFDNINNEMSIFNPNSTISKFNNNKKVNNPKELIKILKASKTVWQQSNGYFDPTTSNLIELWGFGKNKEKKLPTKSQIENAIKNSGFDKVIITQGSIQKTTPHLQVNLSAIAKGYAVDELAKALDNKNIKNYLIDIGGEIKAKGTKNGKSWKIGLADPKDPTSNKNVFELKNLAVATSGDYQNYFIKDNKKYSHTIDPKTGHPAENTLASATVFHSSCMMADAYATAIMAMGKQKAEAFAKELGLKVILIEY